MFNFSHTALWLGSLCSTSPNRAFSLFVQACSLKIINRTEESARIDIWDTNMAAALTSRTNSV